MPKQTASKIRKAKKAKARVLRDVPLRGTPQHDTVRPRLTKTFLDEYAKLNSAQKKAVDTLEGPVLVVAGPGTGKTQVVAVRVANILRRTQMRPSNILCLTFSLSGAKAMRERIRSLIGADAYGVTVATVHSFCNDLILSHPHIFEEFRALEQVSDIERLRIVSNCMGKLGTGSILGKPSAEHSRAFAVLSRISEMKREGIATGDLRKIAPAYLAEIQTTKKGKERDKTSQAYTTDLRLTQQLEEFILLYQGYTEALSESHRYDYEDMILVCLEALSKHEALLASLQERYQYVLIDEFQDLNGAQARLIHRLTTSPALDQHSPNLFAVGDDDQAIYRFQGASLKNMTAFLERFPTASVITLTENYRSQQPIVDAANTLISKNEERLVGKVQGIEKQLISKVSDIRCQISDTKQRNLKPQFLRYPSPETEVAGIAKMLREERDRGTPWNEIAVLCRRNEEVQEMGELLAAAEIPAVLKGKRDLLREDSVREALAILRAVEHPENDVALSAALGAQTFHCHPTELARVWIELRKRGRRKDADLPRTTLRELLLEHMPTTLFEEQSPLHRAYALLEDLSAKRHSLTLPSLLERLLKESGLLAEKKSRAADPRTIAALHALYRYVSRRAYEEKTLTLSALLTDLDQLLRDPHLALEYDVPHLSSDGVRVMTAHAAKGLEFTFVVVPHLRFRNWGDRTGGSLLALPDHLIFDIPPEVEKRSSQEDERRLLYVAMTRAKERLTLTAAETAYAAEELRDAEMSSFLADLSDTIEERALTPAEIPAPIQLLPHPALAMDEAFHSFLRERLESYHLSVTALNAFLEDPQMFLWTQLLEQPQAKPAHLAFGSSVHAALEQRNLARQHQNAFGTDDLLRAFERSLLERELLTEAERAHYLGVGQLVLQRYGKETEHERPLIHSTERALSARLGDIPLFGIVDRIDLLQPNGKHCRIVDYKTGKPYRSVEAVRKEGRLLRQLVFYKLLTELSQSFSLEATLFTLDFLGTENTPRSLLDFEVTESEVKELKQLIQAVWAKIVALDFTPL